ncbi:MAG: FGGY-family carbohydrate kinase [Chloroflexi bacterium]|nr:FGGY-family carbohydrate kinase [Chloroflexota bacterium]
MLTCVLNLGLKSVRSAVFDDTGRRIAIAYRPIETRMGEGVVEQEPLDWWRGGLETLREVLADESRRGDIRRDLRRLTVTASAGCLVALADDGSVVRPAIMISDVRAREQARRIEGLPDFPARGGPVRVTPDLMLPKIAWLREREPRSFERARWFASPNDYLVQCLTGEVVTDSANASKYFYEEGAGEYPLELIRSLGIDLATLPPVVSGADAVLPIRGELADELGLAHEARVVLSTYDAICAVYGSGVAELGEACDVSGTVTSFRAVTDRADVDPEGRLFITPHVGSGRYLAGGSNNLGGGVVEWAKQVLYADDADPYATMVAEAADAPPGAAGLTFLPYLLGERAPIWDAAARGVLFGLGRNHGRGDMIRAIFEGVGYSVLDIADRLTAMGIRIEAVSASGGLARLETVNQIKADMLGLPVRLTDELETTALGAALVAGVHDGRWSTIEEATAACVRTSRLFEPDRPRTEMYRDFFGVYRSLYDRLRELFVERERLIGAHAEVLRTELTRSENL